MKMDHYKKGGFEMKRIFTKLVRKMEAKIQQMAGHCGGGGGHCN